MGFFNKLTAFLPFGKKEQQIEYFFALNIAHENLTAALWAIEGKNLKVLEIAASNYASHEEIAGVTDKLLDQVVGLKEIEPQKILFGVPNSWLLDENLKDEYLKILRTLVKELELTPMAYVATAHALINFMEKQEGVPTTAILVGFEKLHLTVTVVRAGKLDGVKVVSRGESAGSDIEKALLTFTDVETLPSRILIYGNKAEELKSQLLSFSWMSKLSFLHLPKIEVLDQDIEIKSVCLAGGSEIESGIKFIDQSVKQTIAKPSLLPEEQDLAKPENKETEKKENIKQELEGDNFGFMVGDVADQKQPVDQSMEVEEVEEVEEKELTVPDEAFPPELPKEKPHHKFSLKKFIPYGFKFPKGIMLYGIGILVLVGLLLGAYAFFAKADVKIFVEPKILEENAQVVADPNQKTINEEAKIIPGQVVEMQVSGSGKDNASGRRQIGDPAKGTVKIINNSSQEQTVSRGATITSARGVKFTLDTSVTIASTSAFSDSKSTKTAPVTASSIGADGNLASGTQFTITGSSAPQVALLAEGNFSGGTSKDVTVVSSDDQQRLLAKLSSDLKQEAQQKLQEKYPNKKILQEALSENIVKKTFSKNINDQAGEFSLNLTVNYKGTAFDDSDLRTIVSKLVNTKVPDGFSLDLAGTETQADVAKLEKDGKLVFLAKFKAKLMPTIDKDKIRNIIKFKTLSEASDIIKGLENILGSEIKMIPSLPGFLERLPILPGNISIEVGLK